MRISLPFALVFGGCVASDRSGDLTDSAPATPSPLVVEEGGIVVCEAPSVRTSALFTRREAPEQVLVPQEAMLLGGGMTVEDYDQDGFLDLFLPSEDTVQMYFGRPDTGIGIAFDDLASTAFPAGLDLDQAVGGSNVDFDLDGDVDILVLRWLEPLVLLRNDGDRRFSDATPGTGLDKYSTRAQSASWADIDADGDLDLFVGSYGEFTDIGVNDEKPTCDPEHPDGHRPDPVAAQLWRNNGDGTFTDDKDLFPTEVHQGYIFASGFYDLDADGFPELFTAHDDALCAPSTLTDNQGGTTFQYDDADPIPSDAYPGLSFNPNSHDMGMAVADLNGDELPDFVFTSWKALPVVESRIKEGAGRNDVFWVTSAEYELDLNPATQVYGWGTEFGDLDNDADLDLAANFGYWSYYDGAGDPLWQPDGVWFQDGGTFTDQAESLGLADDGMGRGLVLADLNGDGWLDVLKRQLDRETAMYLSNCGSEAWLEVRLRQEGANPRGIGAKIRVITPDGDRQLRWLTSGSSGLYTGAPLCAHFGLGDTSLVDIEVVWPDGEVSRAEDVNTRQRVTLVRSAP